jgi:hypothetical protein
VPVVSVLGSVIFTDDVPDETFAVAVDEKEAAEILHTVLVLKNTSSPGVKPRTCTK